MIYKLVILSGVRVREAKANAVERTPMVQAALITRQGILTMLSSAVGEFPARPQELQACKGSFDFAQDDSVVIDNVVSDDDNVVRAREWAQRELRAPDSLLGIERGIHQRLLVFLGGVLVDGGRGLGAEVAVPGVVLQGAHAVFAAGAGESHAAFDAIDGVVFHGS